MPDNDSNSTDEQTPETVACSDCAGLGATNGQFDCGTCRGTGRVPQ